MVNDRTTGEQLDPLESLLARWQTSLDLHAKYAALDDERYWHVQPWPHHERPQRWIIQLARKRILALKRSVAQRQSEGDRAFVEGIEIMGFLATLVGITTVGRFIPLATPETERRDVLAAKPVDSVAKPTDRATKPAEKPPARERDSAARTAENRRVESTSARTGEQRRAAETTRQMPQLPPSKVYRMLAAQRAGVPLAPPAPKAAPPKPMPLKTVPPKRDARRDPQRPATIKPRKAPGVTEIEHVVIADAVRLLGWGKQWHELGDMISRLAERPGTVEIRRILRDFREHIEAIAARRNA